jgi:hypothetical protein
VREWGAGRPGGFVRRRKGGVNRDSGVCGVWVRGGAVLPLRWDAGGLGGVSVERGVRVGLGSEERELSSMRAALAMSISLSSSMGWLSTSRPLRAKLNVTDPGVATLQPAFLSTIPMSATARLLLSDSTWGERGRRGEGAEGLSWLSYSPCGL